MKAADREISLTETVQLLDGREGTVMGIAHTAPLKKLDVMLANGELLRAVAENEIAQILAPQRPDLLRAPSQRWLPHMGAAAPLLASFARATEVRPNPLMAPPQPMLRGGR